MHTVYVVGGGFALLVSCLLLGQAFGGGPAGIAIGAQIFIPLWLIGAGLNMWLGVHQGGYSFAEEFPIFLGIFAAPSAIAALVWWIA